MPQRLSTACKWPTHPRECTAKVDKKKQKPESGHVRRLIIWLTTRVARFALSSAVVLSPLPLLSLSLSLRRPHSLSGNVPRVCPAPVWVPSSLSPSSAALFLSIRCALYVRFAPSLYLYWKVGVYRWDVCQPSTAAFVFIPPADHVVPTILVHWDGWSNMKRYNFRLSPRMCCLSMYSPAYFDACYGGETCMSCSVVSYHYTQLTCYHRNWIMCSLNLFAHCQIITFLVNPLVFFIFPFHWRAPEQSGSQMIYPLSEITGNLSCG